MARDSVLIVDFGSQFTHLIARRLRELGVYSEIISPGTSLKAILAYQPKGLVLSGGPSSVYEKGAPQISREVLEGVNVPVLGICYGMQLMAKVLGGEVVRADSKEFGPADLEASPQSRLLRGLSARTRVWMSHGDSILRPPRGFAISGSTSNTAVGVMEYPKKGLYGIQFHPEVKHTAQGMQVLGNFLDLCGCSRDWDPASFVGDTVETIRQQVGKARVICALSGGVDSAVTAVLVHRAVQSQLTCVFVDNGLLRKDEAAQVRERFEAKLGLPLVCVDASRRFEKALKGVIDPEKKRKIIGKEFIDVFKAAAKKIGPVKFLAQGTLYPDVIESQSVKGPSAIIKSHHNVGGLPKALGFKLVEPLRELFKDEVRAVGLRLGLEEEFIFRQPFPGPGLAIRVIGPVSRPVLNTLREADAVVVDEIRKAGLYRKVWQSFAVLLPVRSVGVMGDGRTYDKTIAIRAVDSADGMTADWARLPHDLLARMSTRLINEVKGINRVVYDISSKPPATIEWE